MKRLFRSVFLAAAVAAGVAAVKALSRKDDPLPRPATPTGGPWPPLQNETAAPVATAEVPKTTPAPAPKAAPAPAKNAAKKSAPTKTGADKADKAAGSVSPEPDGVPVGGDGWVENVDGECPPGYPIKANMNSKIFHSPGQLNYERTHPDRCYASAEAAEADGLRAAKR